MGEKPHVVCIPYGAQGHINPVLKLAKLLHFKGFHVTFVYTEYNRNRLLQSRGKHSLDGLPSFRFEAIPDGLPPVDDADADVTQDVPALLRSMNRTCGGPFKELLARLNDAANSGVPPVTCIISDGALTFMYPVAEELGIPNAALWTASACGFLGYTLYHTLTERGLAPLKDPSQLRDGYLGTVVIDWVPAVEGITLRHLPSFVRTTDPNDFMFNAVTEFIDMARQKAHALIFNTFTALEGELISSLSPDHPPIYPIGPLHLLINQIEHDQAETKSLGSNLWKEDSECLIWLDARQPGSVVYVNFGSITVMTASELVEFAWGLANSNHYFFWVIRPDLVSGESAVLPAEFLDDTRGRGILASWCDQGSVLSHEAIGVFLTHSGWNSTLESISSGVTMICWPFFAEQQPNCWFTCEKWKIGMEIDSEVTREKVDRQVREMMEGDHVKGKEMKSRATEWKRLAKEAATWGSGPSYLYPENLIKDVLLAPKETILFVSGEFDQGCATRPKG